MKEIINSDGSRNWEANILLDNIKRLEQENEGLKEHREKLIDELSKFYRKKYYIKMLKLCQTLNAIKEIAETAPAIDTELSQRILEVITKSEVGE